MKTSSYKRKPDFFRTRTRRDDEVRKIRLGLRRLHLHTVCEEAHCPNLGECFSKKTATFMILGKICTRNCRFCAVQKGSPLPPDENEPANVAKMAKQLALKHIVITSPTRDDLADAGAEHFAQTIFQIRKTIPKATVEVLTPDFQGNLEALEKVLSAQPEVFNHNLETVPRLYKLVRPKADYARSLNLLKFAHKNFPHIITKSGIMVGLGETKEEIISLMQDLKEAGCKVLTIGQYLAPSRKHLPVAKYYQPEEYKEFEEVGAGFGLVVFAGPLVRSSYLAGEVFARLKESRDERRIR